MTGKSTIKKALLGAGIAVIGLLLCLSLVLALMQTDWGRRETARLIGQALSEGPESKVVITGLQGRFPFHFQVGRIVWNDALGPWLVAHGVTIGWSPWELRHGVLRITTFRASSLSIERVPQKKGGLLSSSTWPPSWIAISRKVRAEDLLVERFSLGDGVLGEAAVLKAEGWLKSAPHVQEASLTAIRLDREGTSLDAHLLVRDRLMTLDVKVHDQGDLLTRAIGLEGPLSVSFAGGGDLKHWEGNMLARAGAYGELRADVTLEAGPDLKVKTAGTLHLRPEGIPPALSHWTQGKTPFHLEAVLAKETLTVRALTLNRDDVGLTMTGSLDLRSGNADGRFSLNFGNIEPLSKLIHRRVAGAFFAEGSFSGIIPHPVINVQVDLRDIELDDFKLSSLQGNLGLTLFGRTRTEPLRLRIRGKGDMRNLKVSSLQEEQVVWGFDVTGPLERRFLIDSLELRGETISLRAAGEVMTGGPLSFSLDLSGQWNPALSLPSLEPFLGKNITYEGQALLEEGKRLSLSQIVLKTPAAIFQGKGTYRLHENILNSSWSITVPKLEDFVSTLEYPGKGSARIDGTAEGPLESLTVKLEAKGKDLLIRGVSIETAEMNLLAHGLPPKSKGQVSFLVVQSGQPLRSQADFVLDRKSISFPLITLEGPETRADGRLDLDIASGLVTGRMEGRCRDLSALSPWFGQTVGGSATLKTDFVFGGTGARLSLALEVTDLSSSYGEARQVRIETRLTEPATDPNGRLNLDMKEAHLAGWSLTSSTIRMEGDFAEARFQAAASGHGPEDFEFQGSGSFSLHRLSMKWDDLKGFYHETPVHLASPLFIEISEKGYSVQGLSVNLGAGSIQGGGVMEQSGMDFLLDFQSIAVDTLPTPLVSSLSGTLSGRLTLRGTPAQPVGSWAFRASGLEAAETALNKLPPLSVEAKGDFQDRRLTANLSLEGLSSDPFVAYLTLPLDFSMSPFTLSLPPQAPLEGSFTGKMQLERLAGFLGLEAENIGGQGSLELRFDGTLEAPGVTGHVRVSDGTYENLLTGTVLSRIEIDISARTPRLQLLEAKAGDGENGLISAEGWLDITPQQGFPLNMEIRLDGAKLFRYDEAVATVSGTLSLEGSLREAVLSGRVTVDSSDFHIPDRLPADIAEVEVVEINKKDALPSPPKRVEKKDVSWPLNLDVTVVSPGRTFVRGRGLDSEWEGQVRVSGKTSQPSVTGTISVVRGRADFLGKNFDVKRGTIAFDGSFPPSPFIDVTAEAAAKDITAQLSIMGTLPSLDIKLSSQPPLPSDEILARLLFGRSASTLTPIQALQLADALNTLSGGGMDLLGRSRRLLGVDRLAVKKTGEELEHTALSAGKYISEDVYLEVEKGISPETGKASLNWDVTPNITVDTEVGINAEGGLGVQWKWDY
jgi:translocation and assembly module TamB